MDNTTAKVSCFARAYHFENNSVPIFSDSIAKKLLGEDYEQIAESMRQGISFFLPGFSGTEEEGLRRIVDKQLSPSVLGRSIFCEKALEEHVKNGCGQYLIFASGYDTFSFRNQQPFLQVYELDLPDVLEDKQKRGEDAGLFSKACYVPCDLAEEGWKDKLFEKGYDREKKAFGSLLGISYYLEKAAWKKLMQTLATFMTKGSAICFDYPSVEESKETMTNKELASGAGEQMKAQYGCEEMEQLLDACGFTIQEHLGHKDMTQDYFGEYNRHAPAHQITAPRGVSYVLAVRR